MVRRRATAGYTLLEVVVAMAVFGIFIMVILSLTVEMHQYERKLPINFMRHPQVLSVVARLRADVLDAHGTSPYRKEYAGFTYSPQILILETLKEPGGSQTVVWDFSTPTTVVRYSYQAGSVRQWSARGLPMEFSSAVKIDDAASPISEDEESGLPRIPGVRLLAVDKDGQITLDQIFFPRTTK